MQYDFLSFSLLPFLLYVSFKLRLADSIHFYYSWPASISFCCLRCQVCHYCNMCKNVIKLSCLVLAYIGATCKNNIVPRAFSKMGKVLGAKLVQECRASSKNGNCICRFIRNDEYICCCSRLLWIGIVLVMSAQLFAIFFPFYCVCLVLGSFLGRRRRGSSSNSQVGPQWLRWNICDRIDRIGRTW